MSITLTKAILTIFAVLIPTSAYSQFYQAEGNFDSEFMSVKTILLDSDKGLLVISTDITNESCSGHVAGIGNIYGRKLTFSPYIKTEGDDKCKFTAEFSQNWDRLTITQSEGCTSYHGASCGWEGYTAVKSTSPSSFHKSIKLPCAVQKSSQKK